MESALCAVDIKGEPKLSLGRRPRILLFAPHYLPGFKSGGPVQAIANMVASVASRYDFYIVTRDRDAGEAGPYARIQEGVWYRVGDAQVRYCSSITSGVLKQAYQEVRPDLISLNSFQDAFTRVAVWLRKTGSFDTTPVILAPHGEFSRGAMAIKPTKKAVYRWGTRIMGLHNDLQWQVSTWREKEELLNAAPASSFASGSIHEASNVCSTQVSSLAHPQKSSGSVRLGFISRISEMKNLHFACEVLRHLRGHVQFDIYGPIAEKDLPYWTRCQRVMETLPGHCTVEYRGAIDHDRVPDTLRQFHFFVLPTKGENFCHAAAESFINGTPTLLSDETPWIHLNESKAGFDIPLNRPGAWVSTLQRCVDMDQDEYAAYVRGAHDYGQRFSREASIRQFRAMFDAVLASRHSENRSSQ